MSLTENLTTSGFWKQAALPLTAAFLITASQGAHGRGIIGNAEAMERPRPTPELTQPDARGQACYLPFVGDPGEPRSYFDAKKASDGGYIVYHYGEGVTDLSVEADIQYLTKNGYPAVAMAGGPSGAVRVFVNGKSTGKFTPSQMYDGTVGGDVASAYDYATKEKSYFSPPDCGAHQIASL